MKASSAVMHSSSACSFGMRVCKTAKRRNSCFHAPNVAEKKTNIGSVRFTLVAGRQRSGATCFGLTWPAGTRKSNAPILTVNDTAHGLLGHTSVFCCRRGRSWRRRGRTRRRRTGRCPRDWTRRSSGEPTRSSGAGSRRTCGVSSVSEFSRFSSPPNECVCVCVDH